MSPQASTAILNILSLTRMVIAGALTFQDGLPFALLKYNGARFGWSTCPLVAFLCGVAAAEFPGVLVVDAV